MRDRTNAGSKERKGGFPAKAYVGNGVFQFSGDCACRCTLARWGGARTANGCGGNIRRVGL